MRFCCTQTLEVLSKMQHPTPIKSQCFCAACCRSSHLFFFGRLSPKTFSFAAFLPFPADFLFWRWLTHHPCFVLCSALCRQVSRDVLLSRLLWSLYFLLFLMKIPALFWPNLQVLQGSSEVGGQKYSRKMALEPMPWS